MAMRRNALRHEFVEFIPEELEEGVVYVSLPYGTAAHKCCCGCGREVNSPIGPTDYELIDHGDSITLDPSIGNWSFPCRSHYFVRRNKVVWMPAMTQGQIDAGREKDRRIKAAYFETVNTKTVLLRRLWRRVFGRS
jgi:hypothetical protein